MSSDIKVEDTNDGLDIRCHICGSSIVEVDYKQVILTASEFIHGVTITYSPAHLSCVLEREGK